jgi:YVTN family beta-propeller protein
LVRTFPVGERNWGIALSPGQSRLYAVAGLSGDITIIDLKTNKVARTVKLGGQPWGAVAVP